MELSELKEKQKNEYNEMLKRYNELITNRNQIIRDEITEKRKLFNSEISELRKSEKIKYRNEISELKKKMSNVKKKVKVKDYKINIDNSTYIISNKDILLYNGFLGLSRYIIFYNNEPISITSDIETLAKNEKIQKLINNNLLSQFLKTDKIDMTTMLLMA